jgi:DDE_Tnp_1-associated
MGMEQTAAGIEALAEGIVFLDYFKDLPGPRQRAKVLYPLDEVLLLCLLAVLAGSEAITDIAGSAPRWAGLISSILLLVNKGLHSKCVFLSRHPAAASGCAFVVLILHGLWSRLSWRCT